MLPNIPSSSSLNERQAEGINNLRNPYRGTAFYPLKNKYFIPKTLSENGQTEQGIVRNFSVLEPRNQLRHLANMQLVSRQTRPDPTSSTTTKEFKPSHFIGTLKNRNFSPQKSPELLGIIQRISTILDIYQKFNKGGGKIRKVNNEPMISNPNKT